MATPVETWFCLITLAMLGAMIWLARFPSIHWLATWPATVMHELAHFLLALLTFGKPVAISLLPKRMAGGVQLGEVTVRNLNAFNGALIALAPLSLLGGAYALYATVIRDQACDWTKLFSIAYLAASALYGSVPSRHDCVQALRKPFGAMVILGIAGACFVGQADAMADRLVDYGTLLANQVHPLSVAVRATTDHAGWSVVKRVVYWALPDHVLIDLALFLGLVGLLVLLVGFRRLGVSLLLSALGCWLIPTLLEPYIGQLVEVTVRQGRIVANRLPWWALSLICVVACVAILRLVLTIFIGRNGADQAMSILMADLVRLFTKVVFILPFLLIAMLWRFLSRSSTPRTEKT
jgi:hypothetical protein